MSFKHWNPPPHDSQGIQIDPNMIRNKHEKSLKDSNICNLLRHMKTKVDQVVTIKTIERPVEVISNLPDKDRLNDNIGPGLFFRYRGFVFALLSSVCFSVSAMVVKHLTEYNPVNIAVWRYQGAFLPAIPLFLVHYFSPGKERLGFEYEQDAVNSEPTKCNGMKVWVLLMARSILTCNALLLHFYSLKYMELGDALVISSSTPVFAYFFAYYFLGEPCGIVPVLTSITTFMGVMVILRPPHLTGKEDFDFETLIGVSLAFGCTILSTVSFVVLRYLRNVHYSIITVAFGSWGTLENLVLAIMFGVFSLPRNSEDWLMASALATMTFFGQLAIIWALKCEQIGPVSLVRTCDVIFGFVLQMIVWKTFPDIYSAVGGAIVILGVVTTGLRKWLVSLPENDRIRTRLWFLLK